MRRPVQCILMSALVLLGSWHLAEAVEPLKAYDSFEVGPISPDRWNGFSLGENFLAASSNLYEGSRLIVVDPLGVAGNLRNLRILNRSYGKTNNNSGTTRGVYGLNFKNPGTVRAIQARLKVITNPLTGGCSLNPDNAGADAQLGGFFFNAAQPTTGDLTNGVFAGAGVKRKSNSADPANVLQAHASVHKCLDADCLNDVVLGSVSLGTVTVGQWVRLLVQWDQPNHQFIFQRDSQAQQFVPYTVSDTDPPVLPLKLIGVNNDVPNCTGRVRPVASMNALFDDVVVNQSALP